LPWSLDVLQLGVRPTDETGNDPSADDLLIRLRRIMPQLRDNRRRVGQYVLDHAWEVRGLTISELARRVGVAENSISRFCHTLGFSGYRDFSAALVLALGRILGAAYSKPADLPHAADESDEWSVLSEVFTIEIQCLHDTLAHLDRATWRAAVDALADAGRVLCLGMGSTAPLAAMAAYRLNYVGIPCTWTSDPMNMTVLVGQLGPGDLAFGLSYSGQTRHTVDTMEMARQRRATTMALTTVEGSLITRVADVPLVIFGPDVALGHGQFAARVAGLVVIDGLVAAVCARKYVGVPPHVDWVNARTPAMNHPVTRFQKGALATPGEHDATGPRIEVDRERGGDR
jgi:DNA-binding MurR/RpiR family transcriptional regulator